MLQKQLKQIRYDQETKPRIQGHPGDWVFVRNFCPGPAWLWSQCRTHFHQTSNWLMDEAGHATMIISGRLNHCYRISETNHLAQLQTWTLTLQVPFLTCRTLQDTFWRLISPVLMPG